MISVLKSTLNKTTAFRKYQKFIKKYSVSIEDLFELKSRFEIFKDNLVKGGGRYN